MSDYNWSKNISPLIGVPIYDYPVSQDLTREFEPRQSYTENLTALVKILIENFSQSHFAMIKSSTNEQMHEIEKLGNMHSAYLHGIFLNSGNEKLVNFSEKEYIDLLKKVRSFYDKEDDVDLEIYDSQYKTIERPFAAQYLYDDDFFAYWRLTGNNPLAIKGISQVPENFPVTNEIYQKSMGGDDTLENALSGKRIYTLMPSKVPASFNI
jgi:arachidonate 15-lipoxygenase